MGDRFNVARGACLFGATVLATFGTAGVGAYEVSTHVVLTQRAVDQSKLAQDSTLLQDIGLNGVTAADYSGSSAKSLIVKGVGDEDYVNLPVPFDWEAYLSLPTHTARVFNHFYDLQYNNYAGRGMTVGAVVKGQPSPDWALEDRFEVVTLSAAFHLLQDPGMPQDYSFRHAQQAYFEVLTTQAPGARLQAASRMFESIGHVVHHVQDMAQPQHARNEAHNDFPNNQYEAFTERLNTTQIPQILADNPYPSVTFDKARQYWYSTESTTDHVPRYQGMAEYTSHNFITTYTPYIGYGTGPIQGTGAHPLPNGSNPTDGSQKSVVRSSATVLYRDGTSATIPADFVMGKVYDPQKASVGTVNRRLATTSIFDSTARRYGGGMRFFGVSPEVWQDGYSALLPRAVGFSSGLIDHLFRGRIDLRRNSGDSRWVVENRSRSGQTMVGELSFWYESPNGLRYPLSGTSSFSINLASGSTQLFSLAEPPIDSSKLIAAFRGQIGAEGSVASGFYAVAGKTVTYGQRCIRGDLHMGGQEGLDVVKEMGNTAGTATIYFYSGLPTPERLVVTSENASHTQLHDTGSVTQYLTRIDIPYDPVTLGSTKIRLRVTGYPDPLTGWAVQPHCPDESSPPPDPLPSRSVVFRFGSLGGSPIGSCTANVFINGTSAGSAYVSAGAGTVRKTLQLPIGENQIQFQNYSCESFTRDILTNVDYNDGSGPVSLGNMSSTTIRGFTVH